MINPILFTENVVADFLKYQLTTYPFADERLYGQLRRLLNLDETRRTPLARGPYFSLSRSFRQGAAVERLVEEGVLHPHLRHLIEFPHVYGHQEEAFRSIRDGRTTLVSTGTGSGKTECFLYPIISRCLELRDQGAGPGIVAVIVYPMNALAEDQLGRLRELLAGSGISFGMYVGKTPEQPKDVSGRRMGHGSSREDYRAEFQTLREQGESSSIYPPEERPSREEMRADPPRILLTNVKQMELLLTRAQDAELFDGARLDFLVFDEAHTWSGASGAETACLVRRLRSFVGKDAGQTTCIATSATLSDPERGTDAAKEFAARFFGVAPDQVTLVGEKYEEEQWAKARKVSRALGGDARDHLKAVLDLLSLESEEEAGRSARTIYRLMTGEAINERKWREGIYGSLAANEVVYQVAEALKRPQTLAALLEDLAGRVGRPVPEEELLCWLALGAAARKEGRPLLRPVVHGFLRGIDGAVVTFPSGNEPRLWLSAEDARAEGGEAAGFPLPVLTCTTCGQHYFEHHVKDFSFTEKSPGGGDAHDDSRHWEPLEKQHKGDRLVLLDKLVTDEAGEEDGDADQLTQPSGGDIPKSCTPLWMCRQCGMLHAREEGRCVGCGRGGDMVRLLGVRQREKQPGELTRCVACGSNGRRPFGGRYFEPARPVRAVAVSDVHVIAQNMLQQAERKRLLIFADNRQDAAFQAGWMRDHSRRYRLRAMIHERLREGSISIGDLTAHLDDLFEADIDLSRVMMPEVWQMYPREAEGVRHQQERQTFLRIQVLREIATGLKQRIGLEPWGRMRVAYRGLSPELAFVQAWAVRIGCEPASLADGIAALLDVFRRNQLVYDRIHDTFTRMWSEGDPLIQRGYMPLQRGIPKGLKLRRQGDDDKGRVMQLLSERGDTLARQAARRWGVQPDEIEDFISQLWQLLTSELELLMPVRLRYGRSGKELGNTSGTRQLDADKLRLELHRGVLRCDTCRRVQLRPTPQMACMAWRCGGTVRSEAENPDNYDLHVLDQQYAMLRPEEHSAQVPADRRETFENQFKSQEYERLNCLVCTPTLELGVDIGALDAVMMRNVPPLPSNYWQRAGRAGRRHRMAVSLTYARNVSHDRAYFREPLKLLEGLVTPPRFNMHNELMVGKHVRAVALTVLHGLARDKSPLGKEDRESLRTVLRECLPARVHHYLFDENSQVRRQPLDVSPLGGMIARHRGVVLDQVQRVFRQGWPTEDAAVVTDDVLAAHVDGMAAELEKVIKRLARRLDWAMQQNERLGEVRRKKGSLDPDEDALFQRCDQFIKRMKGQRQRRRREAEGVDEINTYGVLAAEGFLPGYGLDIGSVIGYADVRQPAQVSDFMLPRPTAVALREFAPGNLIYANGFKFVPRHFHLDPRGTQERVRLLVDTDNQAVAEVGADGNQAPIGLGATTLRAVPICDVDLPQQAHISDEEDFRFQMPVATYGHELSRHGEGQAFAWGDLSASYRRGVHLRLVNVGPQRLVEQKVLGYDICLVCGQSCSPFASPKGKEEFIKRHEEHERVQGTALYADIVVDAFCLQGCRDRTEGYSLAEALRMGAAQVLDMDLDDLQILAVAHPGSEAVDMLLYDPMPGGSGLIEQMIDRWAGVLAAATEIVDRCPAVCPSSCIDCLQTFRNAYYHRYLNREQASERLKELGPVLRTTHPIPPRQASLDACATEGPTNPPEARLMRMLERAGFPPPIPQKEIKLPHLGCSTWPDFYYDVPDGRRAGICIYLDGMGRHIHGNPDTARRDRELREELRADGYEVVEITFDTMNDLPAMRRKLTIIANTLMGRDSDKTFRERDDWFSGEPESTGASRS